MAAKRQLLAAIKPPKPLRDMSDAEKAAFVDQVVAQIAAKASEGK